MFNKLKLHQIKEEPFKQIINEEWKRSKAMLPSLSERKKPKFIWYNYRGRRTATAYKFYSDLNSWQTRNELHFTIKYLKNLGAYPLESFRLVVRHEICHLANTSGSNHDIGASHYRTWNFMEMKPTGYGEPLLRGKE